MAGLDLSAACLLQRVIKLHQAVLSRFKGGGEGRGGERTVQDFVCLFLLC